MTKRLQLKKCIDNWSISFIGNLIGSLIVVCFMYQSHQWEFFHDMVGAKALLIANKKVNLSFEAAFARGVLCNSMVCLAVWLCFSARNVADKIISLVFPVAGFIASGFEHCVANMYFIPMGVVLKTNPEVLAAAEKNGGKDIKPLPTYLERVCNKQSNSRNPGKRCRGCYSGRHNVLVCISTSKNQHII